jgi:hypothetical protein
MKLASLAVSILIISLLSLPGCSREQPSDVSARKTVVKKPISKPAEKESPDQTLSPGAPVPLAGVKKPDETAKPAEEEKDIYLAKADDSLSTIAARKDVYGDPLKWILLYRFNREAFDKESKDAAFPDKNLRAGTKLKIAPPADTGKARKTVTERRWVINVLSSPEKEKIIPEAIRLVDNGYLTYITSANVNGKDYIRLRVGFFEDKTVADNEGKKIARALNVSDVWTTRSETREIKEYSGYK